MTWVDGANATFEALGCLAVLLSVRRLALDKVVSGFDPVTLAFFTAWGGWNLYFYGPALGQWFSWGAALATFVANFAYLFVVVWFLKYPGGKVVAEAVRGAAEEAIRKRREADEEAERRRAAEVAEVLS